MDRRGGGGEVVRLHQHLFLDVLLSLVRRKRMYGGVVISCRFGILPDSKRKEGKRQKKDDSSAN